ncbi:MAG: hypothetical protein ACPGYR_04460 [Chitinophagales bacterium]
MQQGAMFILVLLWVIAILIMLAVLKGYDNSNEENTYRIDSKSMHIARIDPSPQQSEICL